MSNYTDKVNARAEEMAKAWWVGEYHPDSPKFKRCAENFLPLAVLSVQREADAVRAVLDNYLTDEKVIEFYLQSQGLKP